MHIDILFEDDAWVFVNKPAGLLIHPGLQPNEPVLTDILSQQLGVRVQSTHRLDRATSGVIVLTKTPDATRSVNHSFAQRLVDKRYIAIVSSAIDDEGDITEPLTRKARAHGRKKEAKLPAHTSFLCRERTACGAAWLEVVPFTGRQHQIRRHLNFIRCPIWGDKRYGSTRSNRQLRIEYSLHRLALHAAALTLPHPITGKVQTVVAPLTHDLSRSAQALGFTEETLSFSNHTWFTQDPDLTTCTKENIQ